MLHGSRERRRHQLVVLLTRQLALDQQSRHHPGKHDAVVVALGAVFLMTAIARRHLGGTTGDALGAAEQAGETVALAVLAAAA